MTKGSRGRSLGLALLFVSAATFVGCGGKWRHEGADAEPPANTGSAAGSASVPVKMPPACEATLEDDGKAAVPLDCSQGIQPLGNGLYVLDLPSDQGVHVVVTLPSIDTGFFAATDCASASVVYDSGTTYNSDPPRAPDSVAVLRLDRKANELSGSVEGIFEVAGDTEPLFITPVVRFARVAIKPPERDCDCGPWPPGPPGAGCFVPACYATGCTYVLCQPGASVCDRR